jgi:hypothetical protein
MNSCAQTVNKKEHFKMPRVPRSSSERGNTTYKGKISGLAGTICTVRITDNSTKLEPDTQVEVHYLDFHQPKGSRNVRLQETFRYFVEERDLILLKPLGPQMK